jgi:exoribonuclease R
MLNKNDKVPYAQRELYRLYNKKQQHYRKQQTQSWRMFLFYSKLQKVKREEESKKSINKIISDTKVLLRDEQRIIVIKIRTKSVGEKMMIKIIIVFIMYLPTPLIRRFASL